MLKFKGIQKTTLLDYPGEVAATLFMGGCNLRCFYCFNPDLVLAADSGPSIEEEDILNFLAERKNFLDGVCISGGEPLFCGEEPALYQDSSGTGLASFIRKLKSLGYKVKLDTNGSFPKPLRKLLELSLLDYVAMDIKAPPQRYSEIAGIPVELEKINQSIAILKNSKIEYEFRTTVFSGLTEPDFLQIGQWLKGSPRYFLQPIKLNLPLLNKSATEKYACPSPSELKRLKQKLELYFGYVGVRG